MSAKHLKEVFVSFRVSESEKLAWEQAWLTQGFHSRSAYVRYHGNVGAKLIPGDVKLRDNERSHHLKRMASSLSELATLATNDNALNDTPLREMLHEALEHVLAIKKST